MRTILAVAALAGAACSPTAPPEKPPEPPPPPVKITNFYASPERTAPGAPVSLCYGVEQAAEVTIDPPVERVWPALSRCITVSPKTTTTYALKARGASGEDSKSLTVTVDAALAPKEAGEAPLIRFLAASSTEIDAGRPVTICYGTFDAASVRIEPGVMKLEPSSRRCFSLPLEKTTTLTLVARAADGREEREKVTVRVR